MIYFDVPSEVGLLPSPPTCLKPNGASWFAILLLLVNNLRYLRLIKFSDRELVVIPRKITLSLYHRRLREIAAPVGSAYSYVVPYQDRVVMLR